VTTPTPEIDVEDLVVAWLTGWNIVSAANLSTRMPVVYAPPFILVTRVAGGEDYITDSATIQIDSYGTSQTAASDIARQVHHAMRSWSPKYAVNLGGVLAFATHIDFEQTPIFADFEDPVVMRYVARYVIDVRAPNIPLF